MDTTAVKTAMLSAISEELDLWLSKEKEIKDGYEYESEAPRNFAPHNLPVFDCCPR